MKIPSGNGTISATATPTGTATQVADLGRGASAPAASNAQVAQPAAKRRRRVPEHSALAALPGDLINEIGGKFSPVGDDLLNLASTQKSINAELQPALSRQALARQRIARELRARCLQAPRADQDSLEYFYDALARARPLPDAIRLHLLGTVLSRPDNMLERFQSVIAEVDEFYPAFPCRTPQGSAVIKVLIANAVHLGGDEMEDTDLGVLAGLVQHQTPEDRAGSVTALCDLFNTIDEPEQRYEFLGVMRQLATTLPADAQPELLFEIASKAIWLKDDDSEGDYLMAETFRALVEAGNALPQPHAGDTLDALAAELDYAAECIQTEHGEDGFPLYLPALVETSKILPQPMRIDLLDKLLASLQGGLIARPAVDHAVVLLLAAIDDSLPPGPRERLLTALDSLYA